MGKITIGIDEVGRGPLAGPLLVGACALDMEREYEGLADSKTLTAKQRAKRSTYIKQQALSIGFGWVNAPIIDKVGMTTALKLGALRAINELPQDICDEANQIVIDGNIAMLDDPRVITLVKADAKVQAVSAASIVAKVARDNYMDQVAKIFPDYGFDKHKGYGTKAHVEAIAKYGPVAGLHRLSFAPVRKALGEVIEKPDLVSHTDGRIAEDAATNYLYEHGYTIVDRNWKTKYCEIDIVAIKGKTLYLVEVKYRENDKYGNGVEAITDKKLNQMKFAAKIYWHNTHWRAKGYSPMLMVVAMHNRPPEVEDIIKLTVD